MWETFRYNGIAALFKRSTYRDVQCLAVSQTNSVTKRGCIDRVAPGSLFVVHFQNSSGQLGSPNFKVQVTPWDDTNPLRPNPKGGKERYYCSSRIFKLPKNGTHFGGVGFWYGGLYIWSRRTYRETSFCMCETRAASLNFRPCLHHRPTVLRPPCMLLSPCGTGWKW